jgi:hypothetical protein
MNMPIPIPSVVKVISKCWIESEKRLISSIKMKHSDLDEPLITRLFHDELRESLKKASQTNNIENAFLNDLRDIFPELAYSGELTSVSSGLIASSTFHSQENEKKTGGDLGISINRPDVVLNSQGYCRIQVGVYRRGLLCQAKVKRRNGKWGELSDTQEKVLASRLCYLSLLLYEYIDINRTNMMPFKWQLCNSFSVPEIKRWLRANHFPSLFDSNKIINLLGNDEIGTDDISEIENFICPATRPSLEIYIWWPKRPPNFEVNVYTDLTNKQKELVYVME